MSGNGAAIGSLVSVPARFDQRVASHEFSGVALVWRDGAPLLEYAGGLAHRGHGVPITAESRFGVASVTKMVTATTALRLVDRGELRLDQPLIEILPPEHRTRAMTAEHTLHHLLSHTSGLPNYHDDAAQTWDSFVGALDRIPGSKARRPALSDVPAARPSATDCPRGSLSGGSIAARRTDPDDKSRVNFLLRSC